MMRGMMRFEPDLPRSLQAGRPLPSGGQSASGGHLPWQQSAQPCAHAKHSFLAGACGQPRRRFGPRFRHGRRAGRRRKSTVAYSIVADLTSQVGQRLAGTPREAYARDWAVKRLAALGLTNPHIEPYTMPGWVRGEERPRCWARRSRSWR
jgi:hypothetical protein